MYEELIKQCQGCLDSLCGECKYEHLQKPGNFVPCMNALLGEAADAVRELQERVAASEATIKRQSDIIEAKDRDLQRAIDAEPQWISVAERLPEVDKNVLVFACGNEITIGRMKRQTENGYHVFIICHGIARELARPGRITHWMPLPEQPGQKEET